MELTKYSKNRLMHTFVIYEVAREYAMPLYGYLVHGHHPGGFWNAVLANDFLGAVSRSHPGNNIPAMKHAVTWIINAMPEESRGSYRTVDAWLELSAEDRRVVLEEYRLVYTEQEEILMTLADEPTHEPHLW
jgi:hypothetical protein